MGKRGYEVTLAEKGTALGGRVARVNADCRASPPGGRVRDYREQQLHQLPNVAVYFDSDLDADSVLEFGVPRVVVATARAGGRTASAEAGRGPWPIAADARVLTPDDTMADTVPAAGTRVVVWDDDHYYMGGVIAELLADHGCETHYLTRPPKPQH